MGIREWLKSWRLYRSDLGDYMHRWVLQTPWGTLRVHKILRSDDDRALHDHPWDFTSFLLSGGYVEVTPLNELEPAGAIQLRRWPRFSLVRKRARQAHRLILTEPVWTLVATGPKKRSWGFYTRSGWVHWRAYKAEMPDLTWPDRESR